MNGGSEWVWEYTYSPEIKRAEIRGEKCELEERRGRIAIYQEWRDQE